MRMANPVVESRPFNSTPNALISREHNVDVAWAQLCSFSRGAVIGWWPHREHAQICSYSRLHDCFVLLQRHNNGHLQIEIDLDFFKIINYYSRIKNEES